MSRRAVTGRRRVLAAALALLAVVAVGASPAAAADGEWWWSLYNVDGAHADGWTGAGVTIAVIGNQINPDLPDFDGTNLTVDADPVCSDGTVTTSEPTTSALRDSSLTALLIGNGTGATGVLGYAPDVEVVFIGYGVDDVASCETDGSPFGTALQRAMDAGATIVTTSTAVDVDSRDGAVVSDALARGVMVVAAVPDSAEQGQATAPSSYRGVVAVNGMDENGTVEPDSVTGEPNVVTDTTVGAAGVDMPALVDDWETAGRSTSAANASSLVAGMLALNAQKYPGATGNQLLQSLVRNTGSYDHDLAFSTADGLGYGLAAPSHMLRVDPTQYADENPLQAKSSKVPSDAELAAVLPYATSTDADSTTVGRVVVVVVIGVALAALAAVAVVILVGVRRARARGRSAPG